MQLTGTLRNWNDERGFGFIAPTQGGAEIFVHASALPRDGTRPIPGEKLAFEIERGRDGKPQAVRVVRLAIGKAQTTRPKERSSVRSKTSIVGTLLLIMLLATAATWGYKHFAASKHRRELAAQPSASPNPAVLPAATSAFSCDGRTHCSQMTSCTEAKWFINNCPGTQMDGNNDGTPCEAQWCTNPLAK